MNRSHSFNSVHGRMPSVATGALLANKTMKALGVSGDGDTASIGMGQFIHLMRRNVPMIYIIEDNGVYGLTKGQFSATADIGSKLKTGVVNDLPAIDTLRAGDPDGRDVCGRSFSGDKKQLLAMLKAAIAHQGTVLLDVISPCVTFNDHEGSTKSYKYMQEHEEAISEVGFVPHFEDIAVEYDPGTTFDVRDARRQRICGCASCMRVTRRPTSVERCLLASSMSIPKSPASSICSTWSMSRWDSWRWTACGRASRCSTRLWRS
jgi:2-oxoglutarate ferredoxin oxidoreductase subunit beta